MRRSMKALEDEKEIKAPSGRKTRSLLSSSDFYLRRSTRINKIMDNNLPESSENSQISKSRASTLEPEPTTPKSTSKRDVRAGSETKTMTPGRITRKTRASSVSNSEDNLKDSLISWRPCETPTRRRLSMMPCHPSVAEETPKLKAQDPNSMEISVIDLEDDNTFVKESSKEKMPEKIKVPDSGGQVAVDSPETSKSPDTIISTDTITTPGKNVSSCDENKLKSTEHDVSRTPPVQNPRPFKPKQKTLMLLRREKEMGENGTYEEYCFSEKHNQDEKKETETNPEDISIMIINEVKTTPQKKALKSKVLSIHIDKSATDRWISSEKENTKPTDALEINSDCEIDVCELPQNNEDEFLNPESDSSNKSAQDSQLVRSENDESDIEIEVCDEKSVETENIQNRNAVVVLNDILEDVKQKVSKIFTKKRRSLSADFTKMDEKNEETKEVEPLKEVEGEEAEEVSDKKDETEKSERNNATGFVNVEDNTDASFLDWNELVTWTCQADDESPEKVPGVEEERTRFSNPTESLENQQTENNPVETSATDKFEVKESEEIVIIEERSEKKKLDMETEKCPSPKISEVSVAENPLKTPKKSPRKVLEASTEKSETPITTPPSSPKKTSESSIKTSKLHEGSPKISDENFQVSPSCNSCNSQDTIIYESYVKSIQETTNQNSALERSTVMSSPRMIENTQNEKLDSYIGMSEFLIVKSPRIPDVASKSRISEKEKSVLESFNILVEYPTEESPVSLSLRFESKSEIGTPDPVFPLEASSEPMIEVFKEEQSPGDSKLESELGGETFPPLLQSPKQEESPENFSLQLDSRNASESENVQDSEIEDSVEIAIQPLDPLSASFKQSPAKLSLLENINTSKSENQSLNESSASRKKSLKEDSDIEIEDGFLENSMESPKEEPPRKCSLQSNNRSSGESESENVASISKENSDEKIPKLQKSPEKLNKQIKEKSVISTKRLSNGSVESSSENESTDDETEALETIQKIIALQLKEKEVLEVKKELAALVLKNKSEVLKLKKELETPNSKESTLDSSLGSFFSANSCEERKLKDAEEIELKKDESIVKLVDSETLISSASVNRESSIVAEPSRKQTDELEDFENLFNDITEEEFSSKQTKSPSNLEDGDVESSKSNKTFDDSSILILDHDISKSPDLDSKNDEKKPEISPVISGSPEKQRSSKSAESSPTSNRKKKTNGPVVRKIEILKTVIPLETFKVDERNAGKTVNEEVMRNNEVEEIEQNLKERSPLKKGVQGKVTEEEIKENGKERKSPLNPSAEKVIAKVHSMMKSTFPSSWESEDTSNQSSIDSDVAMEFNLSHRKVDDVNLVTSSSGSDSDANSSNNELSLEFQKFLEKLKKKKHKKKKQKKKRKEEEESEFNVEDISLNKKNKKEKSKKKAEPEVQTEIVDKKKKKNREDEVEKENAQIEPQILTSEVKPKKGKKKDKVLPEVPEERIEAEMPERRKKKKSKLQKELLSEVPEEVEEIQTEVKPKKNKKKKGNVFEVSEEIIELSVPEKIKKKKKNAEEDQVEEQAPPKKKKKDKKRETKEVELKEERKKSKEEKIPAEEIIELDVPEKIKKKKKKAKEHVVIEQILQVEEQVPPKKKKKDKKSKEEKIPAEIPQSDLQASSEQSDKKKKKKRRKENTKTEDPEFEMEVQPKKKHRKLTHEELVESRKQQRVIEEQEMKIQEQERRIKDQEIKIKVQEKGIKDREREIEDQEKEIVKEKKKKSKPETVNKKGIKRLPEEVIESLSDIPQKRKKQKLSKESKKLKSKESLSDLPNYVPSSSMINTEFTEIPYVVEEEIASSQVSFCGSTSQFNVSKFMGRVKKFRENLQKRRRFGVFLSYQDEDHEKKYPANKKK